MRCGCSSNPPAGRRAAAQAARWLGYILCERIIDKRNAPPIIHRKPRVIPAAWADASLDIEFPDDIKPTQFVIFGEKASLDDRHEHRRYPHRLHH